MEDLNLLEEWRKAVESAKAVKPIIAHEQALRKMVQTKFFPGPTEGTQYRELPEDWRLKLVYKLDRRVDEAALTALSKELQKAGVNADALVSWSPKLVTKEYKGLTKEQNNLVDQMLVIKPGSPTLELVPPKEPK